MSDFRSYLHSEQRGNSIVKVSVEVVRIFCHLTTLQLWSSCFLWLIDYTKLLQDFLSSSRSGLFREYPGVHCHKYAALATSIRWPLWHLFTSWWNICSPKVQYFCIIAASHRLILLEVCIFINHECLSNTMQGKLYDCDIPDQLICNFLHVLLQGMRTTTSLHNYWFCTATVLIAVASVINVIRVILLNLCEYYLIILEFTVGKLVVAIIMLYIL